ncbi:MAG TPA: hypothetical protein VF857_10405 [Spirochaetota bacterium]
MNPVGTYKAEKVYLWPVYNAGKVDPVYRVTRELEGQVTYTKPTPEERDRLLSMNASTNPNEGYTASGVRKKANPFTPGTFFDAYV